jgi:hypothetical protein
MGTSFYGGGGVVISGGLGSSDYTDLINVPIQVLKGTSIQPIVFSALDFGNYLVEGYYRYNQNDTVYIESTPTNVQVFQDEVTLKKIVKTEIFENGEYYLVALVYEDDGSYSMKKFSFSAGGGGGEAPSEEVLAKVKEEAIAEANAYTKQMMTLNIL